MWKVLKILGGALIVLALSGGLYLNSQRAELIAKALSVAEKTASDKLGVPVKIGGFDINNVDIFKLDKNSDVTIRDIEIFDRQNELIARVDEAQVNFKLLALRDDPVAALDEIKINGALLNLKKRDENSWNVNDIKLESEGESTFDAKISLAGGKVNADFDGKSISVDEISAEADCADMNAIPTTLNAKTLGSNVKASGTLSATQQVVNAEVDEIFFDKVLPYLPADKIPEGVEILRGSAEKLTLHLLHNDDALTYIASTNVKGAAVKVEQTEVENINGNVTLNEREIILDASATANGQQAAASGTIRLDTDETFFDIFAESDSFAPAAIISDIGIDGAASIRAHLVGTAKNPQVDAEIYSPYLGYENIAAQNISTKLRYVGEMIYINDTAANVFGGHVTGSAEIKTSDLSFNAHVKADNLNAANLCTFAGAEQIASGRISADVGVNGGGNKPMKIYGSAQSNGLDVENLHFNEANASFYFADNNLTLDYLSAKLPDGGTLGLEGKIIDLKQLDLNFYGAHLNMALAKQFNGQLDMSGLTDFRGTVTGDVANPNVTLNLSAVGRDGFKGELFKQPFDSINLALSGSLDGINIDDFQIEKGGSIKWKVIEGRVGLTGEKPIDIELDTTAVRAEDIAALVAPDQPITGNVSNTVKITGTLDNPQVAGHIKFNRGSYRGVLLSGMTGDYFLDGDILRLQDFEITSPMVDMVLNGTINKNTQVMDFVVAGKDIRLERFKAKFPENYTAEGHTTFEGIIRGTPAVPIFDGELKSDEIVINGVSLTNIYGHISTNGLNVYLDEFHFDDGDGHYQLQVSTNLESEMIQGEVDVDNADIANMFTMAAQKNELITGKLNSKILVGGTLNKPRGSVQGEISSGTFAGYDIHGIKIDVSLINNTVNITQLEGKQGDKGTINLTGSANLGGALDLTLVAKDIALGIFSKAAGLDIEMVGTSNIAAKLSGTVDDPFGEVLLTATGGIKGSTFDLLHGHFLLKDRLINVEELTVTRELLGKTYGASVRGFVPLKAVFAKSKEALPDNEQLNLTVSLDGADLSLLPVMSKYVAFGVGELEGSVRISGTAARPQLDGQIALNNGSIKLKGMKTLIEQINISMLFQGEQFDIKDFSGNIGGGTFALTGGLQFPAFEVQDYNFDFAAVNLKIDSDFYKGDLNANFNVSEGQHFGKTLPKISGQINVDKCRISIPTLPEDDSPLPEVILDVALNLGEKVRFYANMLAFKVDANLAGNARFEGTTLEPKTSGSIVVKRGGTLTYLESVFNIREGEAHFNQIGTFFPTLHFLAETKYDRTKIFLMVDGSPDNIKAKLTSSPEMSETEIVRLLTLRDAYSSTGEVNLSSADALAIGLRMTILGDLENALKQTLGIDQFSVSRGSGSMFERHEPGEQSNSDRDRDYNVKIGKYVTDKLMVRYTHGFGSHKVHRFGLQYDLNDNLGITVEREGKDYIFSFEARYKF